MNGLALTAPRLVPAWRAPAVVWALVALGLLLVYRDTAAAIVDIWSRSETFTHAFLVPPIVAWLVWRSRDRLQPLQPRPVPWLLLPMAGLAALWWVGHLASVNAAMHLSLAAMLALSVPLVLGWQVARVLAFPLGFWFFAVPIGEFLTPLLMQFTADFVVGAVRAVGIPVYREGQQLVIPSGRWAVVEACSGIRYLMASFMVGSLFAYLNYRSLKRRLIFVGLSLLVPIGANWLRAFIIVMLGHLSDNKIATGVDHLIYGWVFFGIVIMALFFIGARWAEPDAPPVDPRLRPPAPAGASMRPFVLMGLAALLVVQWPLLLARPGSAPAVPLTLTLPDQWGGWQADDSQPIGWEPRYRGATRLLQRSYVAGNQRVGVLLGYYQGHVDAGRLVSSTNALAATEDGEWNPLEGPHRSLGGATWRNTLLLSNEGAGTGLRRRLRVWHLLWIGGRWTIRDSEAKLEQAWLAVRGRPEDSAALFLVTVDAAEQIDAGAGLMPAEQALEAFARANFDRLGQLLTQQAERSAGGSPGK